MRGGTPGIGHNGGPPFPPDVPAEGAAARLVTWKRAHRKAWRSAPREVVMMRLRNAERVGLTYREYVLELLERGRYLHAEDADRIEAIWLKRPLDRDRGIAA